jgi:hypothetical protein
MSDEDTTAGVAAIVFFECWIQEEHSPEVFFPNKFSTPPQSLQKSICSIFVGVGSSIYWYVEKLISLLFGQLSGFV